MARFKELIEVHLKETEAVIAQSALLLQRKAGGQSGELKTAGTIVESYIREFVNSISPDGINITSGYVVNPQLLSGDQNLPQHDIVLTDKASPSLFSIVEGEIEIMPVESVVGIIEVKRTLTRASVESAQEQIKNTYKSAFSGYKTKSENDNTVSISSLRPGTQAPMFGIIGLVSELKEDELRSIIDPELIDFVWAFKHTESFVVGDSGGKPAGTVSRKGINQPQMIKLEGDEAAVFSKLKGVVRFWLSRLASQWIKPEGIDQYYIKIWD